MMNLNNVTVIIYNKYVSLGVEGEGVIGRMVRMTSYKYLRDYWI